jgi:hypothetical protein
MKVVHYYKRSRENEWSWSRIRNFRQAEAESAQKQTGSATPVLFRNRLLTLKQKVNYILIFIFHNRFGAKLK